MPHIFLGTYKNEDTSFSAIELLPFNEEQTKSFLKKVSTTMKPNREKHLNLCKILNMMAMKMGHFTHMF